jgi:hypothetical protein
MHIVNFYPNRTVDFDMDLFGTSAKIIFELAPRKKVDFHSFESQLSQHLSIDRYRSELQNGQGKV